MVVKRKPKEPLTRCHGTLTESGYLAWIRSALRSKSLKWLPRTKAIEASRRPYKGPNKQQKWECQCALCKLWFKQKDICVDHYPVAAGSIKNVADIGNFANNLFCEVDNLRVLCVGCHSTWTIADKMGISFSEAVVEKEIIALCKKPLKEILAFAQDYGYSKEQLSNPEKRRNVISTILKGV